MVEAIISMLIIGVMLVAALNTVGAAKVTERKAADRSHGVLLAQDLLSEILQQAYEDPDLAAGSFGLAAAEIGDGSRALWEDVDDYHGWTASPPEAKDGTVIAGFKNWERQVHVAWVDPADLETVVGGNQGAKRITVTVLYNGVQVAELVAVRTNKADAASPLLGGRAGLGPLDIDPLAGP